MHTHIFQYLILFLPSPPPTKNTFLKLQDFFQIYLINPLVDKSIFTYITILIFATLYHTALMFPLVKHATIQGSMSNIFCDYTHEKVYNVFIINSGTKYMPIKEIYSLINHFHKKVLHIFVKQFF